MNVNFEEDYYLLTSSDVKKYPFIYEDCDRVHCQQPKGKECDRTKNCRSYFFQENKIDNPERRIMDFFTAISKKAVTYADIYMALMPSGGTFVISNNLYNILSVMDIQGIQFIPVTLVENDVVKYTDFWYVHIYNFLSEDEINKIDLEKRLVFKLKGKNGYFLFHKSIMEKIIVVNPVGVKATEFAY
jgi:hypothetical protein